MSRFNLQEVVDILQNNEPFDAMEETDIDEEAELGDISLNIAEMTGTESNNSSLNEPTCTNRLTKSCVSTLSPVQPISVFISEDSYINQQEQKDSIVFRVQGLWATSNPSTDGVQGKCDQQTDTFKLNVLRQEKDISVEIERYEEQRDETDIVSQENDISVELESYDEQRDANDNVIQTNDSEISVKRSRKRLRNPDTWKETIRKRRRQSGLEYTSSRGKLMRKREVKTQKDCSGKCRFKCSQVFTGDERHEIFSEFWKLTDDEKSTYYANTTDRHVKERQRTNAKESRRKSSVKYHFVKGMNRIRVCREFYLSTLDISSKRIEYFYKKVVSGEKPSDQRGKFKHTKIQDTDRDFIRNHIKSFPRIPSHYCRATTSAEYLEPNLSVAEMYRLYKERCTADGISPQTLNFYRRIFNSEFNCRFQKPKKDRCDICEEHKRLIEKVPILETKYKEHVKDKESTSLERDIDRKSTNEHELVVCFDMQNVITCPRSNVSNFFIKEN